MSDRPEKPSNDPLTMLAAIIETLAGEPFVAPALIEAGRKAVHELTARTEQAERDRADRMRAALERIADRNCWNSVETAKHALKMDDYRLADIAKAQAPK